MISPSMREEWVEMLRRSWNPSQWFEDGDPPQHSSTYGESIMWVYRMWRGHWSVGFYSPDKAWNEESFHSTPESAAMRVHWLNGGKERPPEAGCTLPEGGAG